MKNKDGKLMREGSAYVTVTCLAGRPDYKHITNKSTGFVCISVCLSAFLCNSLSLSVFI